MAKMTEKQMLLALRDFDTPSITNVVATYPSNPLCLGLYNPWTENWYTDQIDTLHVPRAGTNGGLCGHLCLRPCPIRASSGSPSWTSSMRSTPPRSRRSWCLQQKFPPEIAGKVGLSGGNMTTAMQAVGCLGLISNGPSRDIDEIRPMKFQNMLTGVCAGHGGYGGVRGERAGVGAEAWTSPRARSSTWTRTAR